jgi:FMN phosphatase YigB (HAD superfamily)
MQFDVLFDGIFCSAEIGLKKPQKEYYEYILDSL